LEKQANEDASKEAAKPVRVGISPNIKPKRKVAALFKTT
jgi:hypothetical protein